MSGTKRSVPELWVTKVLTVGDIQAKATFQSLVVCNLTVFVNISWVLTDFMFVNHKNPDAAFLNLNNAKHIGLRSCVTVISLMLCGNCRLFLRAASVCMSVFTCICQVCVWICEGVCMEKAGIGGWAGLCVLPPLSAPRLSQCGVMSALRLFSRQGSHWKHTLLLRWPISAVTHRAKLARQRASAETISLIQALKKLWK